MTAEPPAADAAGPPPVTDPDAAARGALYGLLARAFREPDADLHDSLDGGSLEAEVAALLDATALDVDPPDLRTADDPDTLAARYNDLFVLGYSEVLDRTDGTISSTGPPVPLYESAHREDVSWGDVNLDVARAYEYFGVEVDGENRENHDYLPLLLEFAGYLCRLAAAGGEDLPAARLDFHDRHLRVAVEGVAGALADEPGTGVYGDLGTFLDRLTRADVDDLAARLDGGGG